MDARALQAKLRKIEALHAGAKTPGERDAAARARRRILERLAHWERTVAHEVEYRFTMGDLWTRRVFVALLERYDIAHYRNRRQRRTTVMASVDPRFVRTTLWPEFQLLTRKLRTRLSEETERIIEGIRR